ncbi:tryptophan 2,3-dioxygenase family protein [Psychroflexus planctonicus]|uniref:Tryptophan 2,3-dioxygenase n=1 Tax=Psychroflexus planctonicus TaxID=1526575 RepID=A0ABQ1SEI8_9FLAO|nr:tryptophan 2,3-dioxygenase family protein [Psychroflexus planctonicus]GGE33144.1 tryptophan 2,3-dioxygenase [Psychroflexus planctonicus]
MGKTQDLIEKLVTKYESLGENPDTYLEGLLHAKPINYWDYIEVETLLALQKPRTHFKDEVVFIGYHQITELVLKLMIHELQQLINSGSSENLLIDKMQRLTRYTDMLITSFSVMKDGMSYEDYNVFRLSLAPASGFQSAQFRFLEIYCTELENLVNEKGKSRLPTKPRIEDYFEHIYWKDAGHNRKTGEKSLTLKTFEDKYLDKFINLAKEVKGKTIHEQFSEMKNPSEDLLNAMRDFDYNYNVSWPLTHLRTAQKYLNKKGENKAATGGSKWQKYLHPRHQQRSFFPSLWQETSILDWKEENV